MTDLIEAPRREPSARHHAAPGRGLDQEIRFAPGLPYETWEEVDISLNMGEWRPLTAPEESLLFRQMNLAYFHAARLRDEMRAGEEDAASLGEFGRLIERAQSIRDALLHAFFKLNLSIAGRFTNCHHPFDELVSEGQLTLLRSISRFDPERGFRFSTYAMHAIRRRILRFIRQRQRERQSAKTWCEESSPVDTRRWTLAYERRISETMAIVERLLLQLPPRERYVLRSRFGWGREFEPRTLREIAAELGVSRERVRQLEERALGKLRKELRVES